MYISYAENGEITGYGDSPEGFPRYIKAPVDFDPDAVNLFEWQVVDGQLAPVSHEPPRAF